MNRTKVLEEIQKNVEFLSTAGLAEYKYIPLHQKPSPSVTALREIMSLLRKVIFPGFFGTVLGVATTFDLKAQAVIDLFLEQIIDLLQIYACIILYGIRLRLLLRPKKTGENDLA